MALLGLAAAPVRAQDGRNEAQTFEHTVVTGSRLPAAEAQTAQDVRINMTKFEGATTPGSATVDRLSRANNDTIFAPRWKGIASLAWEPGNGFDTWVAGRYIGSYVDYVAPRKIGNIRYLDASASVDVEQALERRKGSLAELELMLSGTNLTNKLPDWSAYFRGYDPFNYDLVGRAFFGRLQVKV